MSTKNLYDSDFIRDQFRHLFDLTPEQEIEERAEMLSFLFLSEVEKRMEERKWTRKKLAEEIGTSSSYLTQLFRGDRLLNFKTIAKIEKALALVFEVNGKPKDEELTEEIFTFLPQEDVGEEVSQVQLGETIEEEEYESIKESDNCKIYQMVA